MQPKEYCYLGAVLTLVPEASVDVVSQEWVDHGVPQDLVGVLVSPIVGRRVAGVEGVWAHPGLDTGAAPVGGDQTEDPPGLACRGQPVSHRAGEEEADRRELRGCTDVMSQIPKLQMQT